MATAIRPYSARPRSIRLVVTAASLPSSIIDALNAAVGGSHVECLQNFGKRRYVAKLASAALACRLLDQGDFPLGDERVPVEPAGQNVKWVTLWSVSFELSHDVVKVVLSAYGTVCKLEHEAHQLHPNVCTRNRRVYMNIKTSVPNFLSVNGFPVMCHYPEMRRLCRRCGLEGHILAECQTPRCGICLAYGHWRPHALALPEACGDVYLGGCGAADGFAAQNNTDEEGGGQQFVLQSRPRRLWMGSPAAAASEEGVSQSPEEDRVSPAQIMETDPSGEVSGALGAAPVEGTSEEASTHPSGDPSLHGGSGHPVGWCGVWGLCGRPRSNHPYKCWGGSL
ncbi:uncharacterized protein LOC143236896 [Tachypleus tridentatus]|uniref:uncharacterized protein LOC143236896 n=1 Tax=Tachypleus tridentatus TaxID=6853 RepID=UPI003FD1C82B